MREPYKTEEVMEREMSLLDLWKILRKYYARIIGMTVVGAVLAVVFMMLFVDRQYESEAQLLRSEEHTSELQSRFDLVCRLLLEKKKRYRNLQYPERFDCN